MEKRATMHQVAELAGVSQATVSLVLNGVANARISRLTRRRVQEAAEALGYRRGPGHKLPAGRHRVIGLFIDEISTTPLAAPLIEGARDEAALQDIIIATFCTGNNPVLEQAGLDMLGILAPGREPASEKLAVSGHASGEAFEAHSKSMQAYVQTFVNNLAAAGAEYLREEGSAGARFSSGEPR